MASQADLREWWWNFHQRWIFIHCRGTFTWCFVDNIAHTVYVKRLVMRRKTGWRWFCPTVPHPHTWVCRKHDRAAYRGYMRLEHSERARRIRELGWGQ
ncbi:hypothetical protein [Nocardia africana]